MDNYQERENVFQFGGKMLDVDINEEMKNAYLDYSMSVIISRALPDLLA